MFIIVDNEIHYQLSGRLLGEMILLENNFFEKEGQSLLSGSSFGFKASLVLFLLFKFGYFSAISRVVVVLVTIVTPHVGPLMILR
jgi:hypothetical protein